jgi:hypothetical protein
MEQIHISEVLTSISSPAFLQAKSQWRYLMLCNFKWIDPQSKWGSTIHDVANIEGSLFVSQLIYLNIDLHVFFRSTMAELS